MALHAISMMGPAQMMKRPSLVEGNQTSTVGSSSSPNGESRNGLSTTSSSVYSRQSSEASRLVGCFQELNDRLSAFERLAQLKQMVMEGKLKQDVFEEMYRINTQKLVVRKGRGRVVKKFEVSAISVLDDFCVKHRAINPSPSLLDLAGPTAQFKMKRGCLYFDRIVLKSASTFGSTKETIIIGTLPMTLMFYDDEPTRVDLQFERRHEQFVFDSEVEMLMFVEALDKALETAARSCTSKDEPVLLGRPQRSRSQTLKDYELRKNACMTLEMLVPDDSSHDPAEKKEERRASLIATKSSMQSFGTSASTLMTKASGYDLNVNDDDDEDEDVEPDKEEKEEDSRPGTPVQENTKQVTEAPVLSPISSSSAPSSPSRDSIVSSAPPTSPLGYPAVSDDDRKRSEERAKQAEMLGLAKRDREEALRVVEERKAAAAEARKKELKEHAALEAIRAEEDLAIKDALAARDEDVKAAKTLADCVAAEIAALNALDPEDTFSASTNRSQDESSVPSFPMSNDLRTLIGKPALKRGEDPAMSAYAKLHYNLQQARKALASARNKVEKSSEQRRQKELIRREVRKKVTAQMSRCSQAGKHVAHCEGAVLAAKADLARIDDRVAHFEHCLLIAITIELKLQKQNQQQTLSRPSSPMIGQTESNPSVSSSSSEPISGGAPEGAQGGGMVELPTSTTITATSATTEPIIEAPASRPEKPKTPMEVLESTIIT